MVVLNNGFRSRSVSHSFKTIVFHGGRNGADAHSICERCLWISYIYCPQASSGWFTLGHEDHQGTWNAWASPRLLMLGDFLSLFQSESRRMWYTISLPTIYGENHHCHTKYSGGIPVALDKKIKRSCQSPAWIQGTRAFWLQGLIWTCEAFYGWYVACQSGDCPYFLVASRVPQGVRVHSQSLCSDSAVGLRPMQEGKSLHVRKCGRRR